MLPSNTNSAGGGCFQRPGAKTNKYQLPPDARRDDVGITSLKTKKAYQTDLTVGQDRSQFADMWMRPRFVMPYNYTGLIRSRVRAEGGKEACPVSTIWGNNGALKINPKYVLQHKKQPFSIQYQ